MSLAEGRGVILTTTKVFSRLGLNKKLLRHYALRVGKPTGSHTGTSTVVASNIKLKLCVARLAITVAVLSCVVAPQAAVADAQSIALPGLRAFPESVTSTADGTLFIGRIGDGGIVRVNSRTGDVEVFVPPGASETRSILGVFADESANALWACSNDLSALGGSSSSGDSRSALKGFDLRTGGAKRSIPLPGPHAFCNDITVDAGGAVYVTDSGNPTVVRLPAGASRFEVFATNPQFAPPQPNSAGLDGIAFGSDGALYVTTYATGGFFRIAVEKGRAGRVIRLQGRVLGLPDGLRPLGRNSFLLVEGAGSLDRVEVDGDRFRAVPLRGGFRTPTSVTRVGSTAWVSEGQLSFFFDPARKGQSPSLPFRIYAIPLSKAQSR
jgi:sugar lactone lactonase YvrE